MTQTIALAGKGGVGKTTICGMLIEYLAAKDKGAILAVDADANSNLNEVLGMEVHKTLGEIREEMEAEGSKSPIPAGMTKADYADAKFAEALSEGDDYDLLVMGRTQGKGCYCFVNGILTTQITRYSSAYRYIVVDNEAGLEHLARGILPSVDTVILVGDASVRGVQACAKCFEMVKDLKLGAKEIKLLLNRVTGDGVGQGVMDEIEKAGMDLLGVLPHDQTVYELDGAGKPTAQIPLDNPFKKALYEALDKMNF